MCLEADVAIFESPKPGVTATENEGTAGVVAMPFASHGGQTVSILAAQERLSVDSKLGDVAHFRFLDIQA